MDAVASNVAAVAADHAPAMDGDPVHRGEVVGTNTGYGATCIIYVVGDMKGLMQASGLRWN